MDKIIEKAHFTDGIFYQIELTAKYLKMLGNQLFDKLQIGISPGEFTILDTLSCNSNLCQRDLAKIILKDRANTGKLLDSLENKGYITRVLDTKNNRPVKLIELTELGKDKILEAFKILQPYHLMAKEKMATKDLNRVGILLKELREILKESVEIQI